MIDYFKEWHSWLHARREKFFDAVQLYINQTERQNEPFYDSRVPSDVGKQPYVVDYYGRKHIFGYNPSDTSFTLVDATGEWGDVMAPHTWTNLSFPQGTQLKSTTTGSVLKIKCTDEMIP